jgi:hypothetical protein
MSDQATAMALPTMVEPCPICCADETARHKCAAWTALVLSRQMFGMLRLIKSRAHFFRPLVSRTICQALPNDAFHRLRHPRRIVHAEFLTLVVYDVKVIIPQIRTKASKLGHYPRAHHIDRFASPGASVLIRTIPSARMKLGPTCRTAAARTFRERARQLS